MWYNGIRKKHGAGSSMGASPIPICTASGNQHAPDPAYNHSSGYLLLVWYDYRNGLPDIYGQRVDSLGNQIGSEIAICTATEGNGNA
jgi:hypothetical protein